MSQQPDFRIRVDQNKYLRSTFVNDRRAELVVRATF